MRRSAPQFPSSPETLAVGTGLGKGVTRTGAWVYFWQEANSLWEHVLAIVQALLWPAWMVYEGFAALRG